MRCVLAHISECDGRIDRAHVGFTKRRLKSIWTDEFINRKYNRPHNKRILAVSKEEFCNDDRLVLPICRKHHHQMDYGSLEQQKVLALPQSVFEFADEFAIRDRL